MEPKTVKIPALIDIHVHVREPGDEHKETYASCFESMYHSGVSVICAMPNTKPSLTDEKSYQLVNEIASKARDNIDSKVGYYLYQAATDPPGPILKHPNVCGVKMYLNCTTGDLLIKSLDVIEHYFKIAETKDRLIMCHAEIDILPTVLEFSAKYGQRTHICHVARKSELELIREAKKTNKLLTCEVAPHHLLLTKELRDDNKMYSVKPELQTKEDVETLWENLDVIDCVATDHAPHTLEEKKAGSFGFTGLETLLPLMLQFVRDGRLTLDRMVELTHTGPLRILNFAVENGGVVLCDEVKKEMICKNPLHPDTKTVKWKGNVYSKSKWSPFIDCDVIENPVVGYL